MATQPDLGLEDNAGSQDGANGAAAEPTPEEQLTADRAKLDAERAQLAADRQAFETARTATPEPAPAAPQIFSRDQIEAAVGAGQISETEGKDLWDKQERERVKREIREEQVVSDSQGRAKATIQTYQAAHPALHNKNSDEFQKLAAVFQDLVEQGLDRNAPTTEVAALRAAFGPIVRSVTETTRHETHRENTGGGGGGRRAPASDGDDLFKGIPERQKVFYERQIGEGFYTRDDPKLRAELDIIRAKS